MLQLKGETKGGIGSSKKENSPGRSKAWIRLGAAKKLLGTEKNRRSEVCWLVTGNASATQRELQEEMSMRKRGECRDTG